MSNIDKIVEDAIPLTPNCQPKQKAEMQRREKLKQDIETVIRDKTKPFQPDLQYKGADAETTIHLGLHY